MNESHLATTKEVETDKEEVDMAVEEAEAKIQEEEEETTFKEALMLKIHNLAAIVVRPTIFRKTVGIKTNQSATIARGLVILRRIADSRPITKHTFQKTSKEKETYSTLITQPLKSRTICGTLTAVVAII